MRTLGKILSNRSVTLRMRSHQELAMALFMMVTIAFFLAITTLLWCLSKFNSEIKTLRKPRRPVVHRESDSMPYQRERSTVSVRLRRRLAAKNISRSVDGMNTKVASLVALAILLGSR